MPTVRGATDADVAYGLALAHAEDDFASIERVMLAARGRLAMTEGRSGLASDFLWHTLRIGEAVAADYSRVLTPATRALVEAYAAGINAYRDAHPEQRLHGSQAVRGQDVVAGFMLGAPLFWGIDRVLADLYDGHRSVCEPRPPRAGVPERGSNALAVAPSRSADGHTRLLVNSHQPWTGLATAYEAHIESGDGWRMHGAVFPGAPMPLMGHNGALGWAATINRPALADLYRLTTDTHHPGQYLFDGRWRAFDKRTVWLHLGIGPLAIPVPLTLRFAVHGPAFETPDGWIALRYAGDGDVRVVEQYYRMTRARTFEAWQAALAMRAVPSTSLAYADAAGHIGLFYNASIPRRSPDIDWSGCVRGDVSDTLWRQGDWAAVPALIDPPSGWLYSANGTPFSATDPAHDLAPEAFADALGIEMQMNNRGHRFVERLSPLEKIGEEDLVAAKFDLAYSGRSEMRRAVAAILVAPDDDLADVRAVLRDWDFTADRSSRAAALAVLMYAPIRRAEWTGAMPPDPRDTVKEAAAFLRKGFGRLDPPLGDVLRLRRGRYDLPLDGGPDVARVIGWTAARDGRLVADFGDTLVMLIDWAPDGSVTTHAVHQFGAAVAHPTSPHYDDQAEWFAQKRFRPR